MIPFSHYKLIHSAKMVSKQLEFLDSNYRLCKILDSVHTTAHSNLSNVSLIFLFININLI